MSQERFINERGNKMLLIEIKILHNKHLAMNSCTI